MPGLNGVSVADSRKQVGKGLLNGKKRGASRPFRRWNAADNNQKSTNCTLLLFRSNTLILPHCAMWLPEL